LVIAFAIMGKKYIFLMMIKRSAISLSNVKVVIVQDQQKQIFENIEIDTVKKRVSQVSLGLALCKIAVQAQGGMLAIKSN
jgi:K+-sensing histidine kinase KdpD